VYTQTTTTKTKTKFIGKTKLRKQENERDKKQHIKQSRSLPKQNKKYTTANKPLHLFHINFKPTQPKTRGQSNSKTDKLNDDKTMQQIKPFHFLSRKT